MSKKTQDFSFKRTLPNGSQELKPIPWIFDKKPKTLSVEKKKSLYVAKVNNSITGTPESLGPSKSKKPKIDSHIKKELFKKQNERKSWESNTRRKKPIITKHTDESPCPSPLIEIESVEEKLYNNQLSTFSHENIEKLAKSNATEECDSSETEFLLMEDKCLNSPISSVCNLLKDTNIQSAKKPNHHPTLDNCDLSSIITGIERFIEEESTDFNNFKLAHEKRMKSLQALLATLKNNNQENMPSRRSQRLAVRNSPYIKENTVSPAIKKSEDLRKKALANNLSSNLSPKLANAMNTFSNFKKSLGYLETPKSEKGKKLNSDVSMMLFEQAYRLQDTPAQKK